MQVKKWVAIFSMSVFIVQLLSPNIAVVESHRYQHALIALVTQYK